MAEAFPGIGPIRYEGPDSKNPLAFRHYNPTELVEWADVVITCLPTSREVEGLLDGPDGLLAGLAPGALLIDCTSGDPATRRTILRLAASGTAMSRPKNPNSSPNTRTAMITRTIIKPIYASF